MTEAISSLLTVRQYREQREHIFPSESSFDWFSRHHRRELVEAGALLVIAGRRMVNPSAADRVVAHVGQATAQASLAE